MSAELEELERLLVTALLAGDDPLLEGLRTQFAAATVRGREQTGSGFVTQFDVPQELRVVAPELLHLDDLQIALAGAETPAEASLTIQNGVIRSLECNVYAGVFPASPAITAAWYYGSARFPGITPELLASRDVDELLAEE